MSKATLVVKRDILFSERYFQGFLDADEHDYISKVLENYEYYIRGDELENNSSLQQVIPYVWVINPKEKKVFAYKRASGKQNYSETRLMDKISCGVGGHIDREDSDVKMLEHFEHPKVQHKTQGLSNNPIEKAMMRELMEEIVMKEYPKPKIVGYLNDDSDSVGRVHFGIVAVAETTADVKKGDNEMAHGRFYSIDELERLFSDTNYEVESWTRISWPFVKNYLERL